MKPSLAISVFSWAASVIVMTVTYPSESCYAQTFSSSQEIHSLLLLQQVSIAAGPEQSIERSKEMVEVGNYKAALSILSPFISQPMKYPAAISDYIVIFFWDGRADEAIGKFEALPDSFPRRPYLLRNMARAYYEKKEFLNAASLYATVFQEIPSDYEAQKGLVSSFIKLGYFEMASDYLEKFDIKDEQIYKIRDDLTAALPKETRDSLLSELRTAAEKGDEQANLDYILVLILNKDYVSAISTFETANIDIGRYSDHLLCWIAWAYFKVDKVKTAIDYYQMVLVRRPDYVRANIGLTYCLSVEGQGDRALKILDKLLLVEPQNLEIRFARAFVHEKAKRFWSAIGEYDIIIELSPQNNIARRLKLRALSDMGASSNALEQAYKEFPHEQNLHHALIGDMVDDLIRWEEPEEAIKLLFPLIESSENPRIISAYIMALVENSRMEEAVALYESLVKDGRSLLPWVLQDIAEAYFYLEQPYKALAFYEEALKKGHLDFDDRIDRFYVLQEIRAWDEAEKALDELDQEQPPVLGTGKNIHPNWSKLELSIARGWLYAYQDRLREAEKFFWNLYKEAPAQPEIRNGIAHVYLWRGWPRKALKEFGIIESLDPTYVKAQIGKVATLNELAFKNEAYEEADRLLALHPEDKHVRTLVRNLKVERMRELVTDVMYSKEKWGDQEIGISTNLSQPIFPNTHILGSLSWQRIEVDDELSYFQYLGLGINHIFNSTLSMRQVFSVNHDGGYDFGTFTQVNLYPNDYWNLSLSYNNFAIDIPIRARASDIKVDKLNMTIAYRASDWQNCNLSLSHFRFDDDNDRDEVLFNYEQGIWVKGDWKMRLVLEFYGSRNSLDDAPYFNPASDWSLAGTHMTEHTLWRIYERAFVQRLFLTFGNYKQSGFSNDIIGAIRYEQDFEFSNTQGLLWGAVLARNVYDGIIETSFKLYLQNRWRF